MQKMYNTCTHQNTCMSRLMSRPSPLIPLLAAFSNHSSFTTHAHDSNKSPIQLQDANVPLDIQQKLNDMLTNKSADIISKSPTDFGRTNLIEMNLPISGPPSFNKTIHHTFKMQILCWEWNKTSWRCQLYFQVTQWLAISDMHHEEEARPKPARHAPTLHVYRPQKSQPILNYCL